MMVVVVIIIASRLVYILFPQNLMIETAKQETIVLYIRNISIIYVKRNWCSYKKMEGKYILSEYLPCARPQTEAFLYNYVTVYVTICVCVYIYKHMYVYIYIH